MLANTKQREMNNKENKAWPESYPMASGDSPNSYSKNSYLQKGVVDGTKELISEAIADKLDIESLCLRSPNTFCIADFGCSTGPNTFFAMQNIVEAVQRKYEAKHQISEAPEFQVFFNDHSSNDFNTLFRSLPPSRNYFASGVPGSFYGSLFPQSSLHFAYSANALHWLSHVPDQVIDRSSPAWNKGRIYCSGDEKEVTVAFSAQYAKDIDAFLSARAKELVDGGLMVLLVGGVPKGVSPSQTSIGKFYDLFGSCFYDMAKKGLISEDKVDSFNLPLYYPSAEELEALIHRNGYFSIEKIDELTDQVKRVLHNVQLYVLHIRAGMEGLIESHFGNEIMEELFECYTRKHEEHNMASDNKNAYTNVLVALVLKRKRRNN